MKATGTVKLIDAEASYSAPALEKGLDVLELLAHEPAGLTKSEIARKLNRTVSEIFRMLICLEQRGYITQMEGDQYALTLKLFKLVQEHPPTERLIADATPVMHRFAFDTLQSCHLGVIEGSRIVVLAQASPPASAGFFVKLGSSIDIMETATGYVILAFQSKGQCQQSLDEWRRETGKKTPSNLERDLARIRKRGFETRPSYQVEGITNLTYPIFDNRGWAIGALTVPYIQRVKSKMTRARVTAELCKRASEITNLIGGQSKAHA